MKIKLRMKKRMAIELIITCALLYAALTVGDSLSKRYDLLGVFVTILITISAIVMSIRFVTTDWKEAEPPKSVAQR